VHGVGVSAGGESPDGGGGIHAGSLSQGGGSGGGGATALLGDLGGTRRARRCKRHGLEDALELRNRESGVTSASVRGRTSARAGTGALRATAAAK